MKQENSLISKIFMVMICFLLTGCGALQEGIDHYSKGKEMCYLNKENITEFTYQSESYTILNETVSKNTVSNWVGYIRKLVLTDESGKIIYQEDSEKISINVLADKSEEYPNAKYAVPFNNVYKLKDSKELIVEVNGEYHKAILTSKLSTNDTIFNYQYSHSASDKFKVNPDNGTQLLRDGKVYQVTSKKVSKDKLGKFLSVIAEDVTFEVETKKILNKEELSNIDWSGTKSQKRENWFYTDVYEILENDISKAVAVKVNNEYYAAIAQ